MTYEQADTLAYYFQTLPQVSNAKVYERTADAVVEYNCDRDEMITLLKNFEYDGIEVPEVAFESSSREMNAHYSEKIVMRILWRIIRKLFLPARLMRIGTVIRSIKYLKAGLKCLIQGRMEVPLLDAIAIFCSLLMRDFKTAGSVMFLLGIGDTLEEWTHKRSVGDLARNLSLNLDKVWIRTEGGDQILVKYTEVKEGDKVVVHVGNVIPFDGIVAEGEAMVNQSSLTGEPVPVEKMEGVAVFGGTVVEEGELVIKVTAVKGAGKYDQIVKTIEESEKLKSTLESRAEHIADGLVPWTLGGTLLTYLITRNVTKAMSVLMVDFSCALKLAMPLSVLSAIREASIHNITVKGGKFLESVADADTIVFDKTGTLTKATPSYVKLISFDDERSDDELLRIAACLEEHFPHSMATAVVEGAKERGIEHEEMHSKVEYIVAHGIATTINGKRVVIGSHHFIFDDEKCKIPEGKESVYKHTPKEYSHLNLAIDGELKAVLCIDDPVREEAVDTIDALRKLGIKKVVMMTGDSDRTARAVAEKIGVDEYYSEVLPDDKAGYVEKLKESGHKVIMVGDGINDSPALSASSAGIAIGDGAEIAREIADITIGADNLNELVVLRDISMRLMRRIKTNYRAVVGINLALIGFGVTGVMQPATTALLHNASTVAIGLKSTTNLLEE